MEIHILETEYCTKPHMVSKNLNLNVKCKTKIFGGKYKKNLQNLLFAREYLSMISEVLSKKYKFDTLDFINI